VMQGNMSHAVSSQPTTHDASQALGHCPTRVSDTACASMCVNGREARERMIAVNAK